MTTSSSIFEELATQADVLELGWRLHIVQLREIQSWARRWMQSDELDSDTLVTLSTLTQPRASDISLLLRELITMPRRATWVQALGLLSVLYLDHRFSEQDFARALYRLGCEEEEVRDQELGLLSYDDDLVMSSEPAQVSEQLLVLARTYAPHVGWFAPESMS